MKQVIAFLLLSLLCAFISTNTSSGGCQTEAVISLDDFSDPQIHKNIKHEFSKINGVSFCETSFKTKTVVVQFDESKVQISDIGNVFSKWGCKVKNMTFHSLADFIE
jgi:copper chaperone CopZ